MIIECKTCCRALFEMRPISGTKAVFDAPIKVCCKKCNERWKSIFESPSQNRKGKV